MGLEICSILVYGNKSPSVEIETRASILIVVERTIFSGSLLVFLFRRIKKKSMSMFILFCRKRLPASTTTLFSNTHLSRWGVAASVSHPLVIFDELVILFSAHIFSFIFCSFRHQRYKDTCHRHHSLRLLYPKARDRAQSRTDGIPYCGPMFNTSHGFSKDKITPTCFRGVFV